MMPPIRRLADRIMSQQVRRLAELLFQAHELIADPPEGSAARADLDHINSRPASEADSLSGLRWWATRAAVFNLDAADEHLEGLRAILAAEALLPLPAMAVGRSVYEAVINTCWLVDVEVSIEQRLARWAGRLLHDGQEPTKALDSFGEALAAQKERERVAGARELGQELMTKAGFELKAKGGDRFEETASVSYGGEVSRLTPIVTDFVDRFTPSLNLWHMFSGATHNRGWLIDGLEGPDTEIVTSIMTPLLDTADALAVEVCRYFGMNPRATVQRTHTNRVALLRQARPSRAPFAGVDHYRETGGLWPLPPRKNVQQ